MSLNIVKMVKIAMFSAWVLLCVALNAVRADPDDIEAEMETHGMMKLIRAMTNQTKADTLNLPSNATSIRENITDTFSCENRIYGYYADVDNDCQIFHVCLPVMTTSGRNRTYKWSFICPQETVFNQEVLVCTRERDSINCTDSPLYYDLNMEIGKTGNGTAKEPETSNLVTQEIDETKETAQASKVTRPKGTRKKNNFQRRPQSQNIVLKDMDRRKEIKVPEAVVNDYSGVHADQQQGLVNVDFGLHMNPNELGTHGIPQKVMVEEINMLDGNKYNEFDMGGQEINLELKQREARKLRNRGSIRFIADVTEN